MLYTDIYVSVNLNSMCLRHCIPFIWTRIPARTWPTDHIQYSAAGAGFSRFCAGAGACNTAPITCSRRCLVMRACRGVLLTFRFRAAVLRCCVVHVAATLLWVVLFAPQGFWPRSATRCMSVE